MERKTLIFGGDGGNAFGPRHPQKVGLRTGDLVDAIIINDEQFGGNGGNKTNEEELGKGDYWSEIHIRSGSMIDRLKLVSKKGRVVEGGGGGGNLHEYTDLRVIAIGGRSGSMVDSLRIDVVLGYVPSTLIEANADVVFDVRTGGQVIKQYRNESTKTAHSYQLVTQHMLSTETNASAEGEYYAKFSVSTSIKTQDSRTETIASQSEAAMQTGESDTQTIPNDCAAFLIGKVDIMRDSDNNYWMAPTSGSNWVMLQKDRFHELAGKYDLSGGARTQSGLGSSMVNGFPKLST